MIHIPGTTSQHLITTLVTKGIVDRVDFPRVVMRMTTSKGHGHIATIFQTSHIINGVDQHKMYRDMKITVEVSSHKRVMEAAIERQHDKHLADWEMYKAKALAHCIKKREQRKRPAPEPIPVVQTIVHTPRVTVEQYYAQNQSTPPWHSGQAIMHQSPPPWSVVATSPYWVSVDEAQAMSHQTDALGYAQAESRLIRSGHPADMPQVMNVNINGNPELDNVVYDGVNFVRSPTVTGRMSSNSPSLDSIPRTEGSATIAPPSEEEPADMFSWLEMFRRTIP